MQFFFSFLSLTCVWLIHSKIWNPFWGNFLFYPSPSNGAPVAGMREWSISEEFNSASAGPRAHNWNEHQPTNIRLFFTIRYLHSFQGHRVWFRKLKTLKWRHKHYWEGANTHCLLQIIRLLIARSYILFLMSISLLLCTYSNA